MKSKTASLCAAFLLGSTATVAADPLTPVEDLRDLVEEKYYQPVEEDVLSQTTIEGILGDLDPYSVYYTEEGYQQYIDFIQNKTISIGVKLMVSERGLEVTDVLEGTTATEEGVMVGDLVHSIDGETVYGRALSDVNADIYGPDGTSVDVTFYRVSTDSLVPTSLTRTIEKTPVVEASKLAGNVGYMKVSIFNHDTVPRMQEELREYEDVEHWILDVQNNPGGYVTATQKFVGMFEGVDVTMKIHSKSGSEVLPSDPQPKQFEDEVDLLINERSASASEVVAGALQDSGSATLYGTNTFGKGLMQNTFTLDHGGYVVLTTASFRTPDGNAIQGVGISPDVKTTTPLEDAHEDWFVDHHEAYERLAGLKKVPTDKVFHVKLSTAADVHSFVENVQLVHLGGGEVPVTINQSEENAVDVTPQQPLVEGEEYLLLVHPGWESEKGVPSEKGVMTEVLVRP
ncbi:PDZ domain-containing protein [Halobacillus litoralis]|uniref:S41 family peptidase n=1 Tax=Halobacillus litoralis TaxID=45668 RepID=UPI001CD1AA9D|nr:S41 family peptidase [Halobacillus litoralis]MCA0970511.1 PDZ domain-containing protein [Halobacillus litoralis]